jgi:hypothetical protein
MTPQPPPPPAEKRRLSDWWFDVPRPGKVAVGIVGIVALFLAAVGVLRIYEMAREGGCEEALQLDRDASLGQSNADDVASLADDPDEEARWNLIAAAWNEISIETIQSHRGCFDEELRDMVLDGYQRRLQQRRADNPSMPSDLSEVADCLASQGQGLLEQLDCVP